MADFMSPRDWNDPRAQVNPEEREQRESERIARDQMMMMAAAQGLSSPTAGSALLNNNFESAAFEGGLDHGAAIDTPIDEQLRRLLVRFFVCYAPQRLIEIPAQLRRLLETGATAVQVYKRLKEEYGCVPVEREVENIMRSSFGTRLYCYFARYNPAQFRNVGYLAEKYLHAQRDFFLELETKYGVEQDPLRLFAPEAKKEKEDLAKLLDESDSDSDFETEQSRMISHREESSRNLKKGNSKSGGNFENDQEGNDNGNNKNENDPNNKNNNNTNNNDLGKSFSNALGFNNNLNSSFAASSFAGGSFAGAKGLRDGKENNDIDDDDDEDNEHQAYHQTEEELIHSMFSKVGVDPAKLRGPLPRFYDPLGTMTRTKVDAADMEML